MDDIIFLKIYTLEQPLKILFSTFLNVNIIFGIFGLFQVKNYKDHFNRNEDLMGTQIGKRVPIGTWVPK